MLRILDGFRKREGRREGGGIAYYRFIDRLIQIDALNLTALLLNSMVIDSEAEHHDKETLFLAGVANLIVAILRYTRTDLVQRPAALTTYQHIVIKKNLSKVFYIYIQRFHPDKCHCMYSI